MICFDSSDLKMLVFHSSKCYIITSTRLMTWCLIRDVHRSDKTTMLYLQDPEFQRQLCLSFSWAFIPTSHMSAHGHKSWPCTEGFSANTFEPLKYIWAVPSQPRPPQPPELFPLYEGAVRDKKMFSPHQALLNSWQRITLEKLIFKQLWRRFVNLRWAGWDRHCLLLSFCWKQPADSCMAPNPALKPSRRKICISSSCCIFLFFSQAFPWLAPGFQACITSLHTCWGLFTFNIEQ